MSGYDGTLKFPKESYFFSHGPLPWIRGFPITHSLAPESLVFLGSTIASLLHIHLTSGRNDPGNLSQPNRRGEWKSKNGCRYEIESVKQSRAKLNKKHEKTFKRLTSLVSAQIIKTPSIAPLRSASP